MEKEQQKQIPKKPNLKYVNIKTGSQHFWCAEKAGGSKLVCNRQIAKEWETFEIVYNKKNGKINLLSFNGHFVSAENGGGGNISVDKKEAREFEQFDLEAQFNGKHSIKTFNGQYVSAVNNGGSTLHCNATQVQDSELFELIEIKDYTTKLEDFQYYYIRTDKGYFFNARQGGGREMMCDSLEAKDWEKFQIIPQENGQIALKTFNNYFVGVEQEGKSSSKVVAIKQEPKQLETFELQYLFNGKICIKSYGSFYMTAENYGGRDITCHRQIIGDYEQFTFINVQLFQSQLVDNDKYFIKTKNWYYFSARNGGGYDLTCDKIIPTDSEIFQLVPIGNEHYCIKTQNGHFWCAEQAGGSIVTANRKAAQAWEYFFFEYLGNEQYALKSYNGYYVKAQYNGGGIVKCDNKARDHEEIFYLIRLKNLNLVNHNQYNHFEQTWQLDQQIKQSQLQKSQQQFQKQMNYNFPNQQGEDLQKQYTQDEYKFNAKTTQDNNENQLCIICIDKPKTHACLPCCHFSYCEICIKSLTQCSICRSDIQQKIKMFQ